MPHEKKRFAGDKVIVTANPGKLLLVLFQACIPVPGTDIGCSATVQLVKTAFSDKLCRRDSGGIDSATEYIEINKTATG